MKTGIFKLVVWKCLSQFLQHSLMRTFTPDTLRIWQTILPTFGGYVTTLHSNTRKKKKYGTNIFSHTLDVETVRYSLTCAVTSVTAATTSLQDISVELYLTIWSSFFHFPPVWGNVAIVLCSQTFTALLLNTGWSRYSEGICLFSRHDHQQKLCISFLANRYVIKKQRDRGMPINAGL